MARSSLWSRPAIEVYVLLAAGDLVWLGFVPLLPEFDRRLDLSGLEIGLLLSTFAIAVGVASLPAGIACGRWGAKRVVSGAALLMVIGSLLQAAVSSYALVLSGRVLSGLGFGAVWVGGVAILTTLVPPERRDRVTASTMVIAGVGIMIGPGLFGIVADAFGLAAPSIGAAVLLAFTLLSLVLAPEPADQPVEASSSPRAALTAVRREPLFLIGLLAMAIPGFVNNGVNTIVPLDLDAAGISASGSGLIFSLGAFLFLLVSLAITRRAERFATPFGALAPCLLLGALLIVPATSVRAAPLTGFLLARSPVSAVLFAIAVPLAMRGAARSGIAAAVAAATLNLCWSASAISAPLLAGLLLDVTTTRIIYALLSVVSFAGAGLLLVAGRRVSALPEAVPLPRHG